MTSLVTVAVDAMGGDNAPSVVLNGVEKALFADSQLHVMLLGSEDVVVPFCAHHSRCTPVVCTEVIAMGEHPAEAVRQKKDSSIVRGCQLVKDNQADGFFSAGSTGACLAAATLVMGRIKGVKRPALGIVLPAYKRPVFFTDVGANADCKPEFLLQFAKMGEVYMRSILHVPHPRVGLLNIGEEDTKGSVFAQEVHGLLARNLSSFAGNCEGGDLMEGAFDVVVTDGFTGNVCLKTIEGTSKTLFKYLKKVFMANVLTKIGASLLVSKLKTLKKDLSPEKYGGSPLLGVKGTCIVGHGSSNDEAIKNGILTACVQVRAQVSEKIADAFSCSDEKEV